ncbi:nuclear/nucleolar GTPase 2-like [Malus domestica]|uniref:nuclear/nucleolar GTPase 2-like n=1 Tax=Malus domestica TaxID=3750 RepID=UPI0039764CC9
MVKKTERKVNVSGKPKHSLDANRSDAKAKNKDARTGATVHRLKMYNTRPKAVSTQQELDIFREEHSRTVSSNYNVILRGKHLPLSLLNDHQKMFNLWILVWMS